MAQLEQAARLDPLSAIIQVNLGSALEAQGRFRDAASRYRRAIEIDPLMPGPYTDLALLAAYAMNDFAAAVPLAEKAAALDPDSPFNACWWRGCTGSWATTHRPTGCCDRRKIAGPTTRACNVLLALRDLQGGDRNGAERYARRALEANPRDRVALSLLGVVDYREGRYAESVARYRKAYPELFSAAPRIDASNFTTAIDMVPALQKLGKTDEALALLAGSEKVMAKLPLLRAATGSAWSRAERRTSAGAARPEAGGARRVAGGGTGRLALRLALPSRSRPGLRLDPRRAGVQGDLRRHRARHGAAAGRAREAAEGRAARPRRWRMRCDAVHPIRTPFGRDGRKALNALECSRTRAAFRAFGSG